MVNRFAKRDPALYPLAFIMVGIAGATGYFFVSSPPFCTQLPPCSAS